MFHAATQPVFRGRQVTGFPPLSPQDIWTFGFIIAGKQAGPFRLEIDWIEANFVDWRDHGRGFEGMAMYSGYGGLTTVLGGAVPVRAAAAPVSADFFPVLGVEPLVGRAFLDEESRFGGDPAVVVSFRFWRRHLEGSRDLGGRTLRFGGRIYRVVGVMPLGFDFPRDAELWFPSELSEPNTSRTAHNWNVIARLAPGASLEGVRSDMASLAARIKQEYGDDVDAVGVRVAELHDALVGGIRRPLVLLLAASALVLLVAATNLASTLLARAVARQREIAVRAAIGAGRMRVVRQLLTEAVLLTTLGGLAGLGLAALLVRTLKKVGPASLPRLEEVAVDGTVLLFTLTVSTATGLVFGLVPALQASRADLRILHGHPARSLIHLRDFSEVSGERPQSERASPLTVRWRSTADIHGSA